MVKSFLSLREQFILNDKAIIPVKITNQERFYDEYDRNGLMMSEEIAAYLDKNVSIIPKRIPVALLFCCPEMSDTKKDAIKNMVKIYDGLKYQKLKRSLIQKLIYLIIVMFAGVLFLTGVYATKQNLSDSFFLLAGFLMVWPVFIIYIPAAAALYSNILSVLKVYNAEINFKIN
jgi:hypothetical protein